MIYFCQCLFEKLKEFEMEVNLKYFEVNSSRKAEFRRIKVILGGKKYIRDTLKKCFEISSNHEE